VRAHRYLDQEHVKRALGADTSLKWEACSAEVDKALGGDVMKTVKRLVSGGAGTITSGVGTMYNRFRTTESSL
jgi:hypothetical protein